MDRFFGRTNFKSGFAKGTEVFFEGANKVWDELHRNDDSRTHGSLKDAFGLSFAYFLFGWGENLAERQCEVKGGMGDCAEVGIGSWGVA
jgi:hypothetical protein